MKKNKTENKGAGKPALYGKPMKRIQVRLDEETLALLAKINRNRSKAIRDAARMAISAGA